MKKYRILWGVLWFALLVNLMISESVSGLYLFLGAVCIPCISVLLTWVCVRDLDVRILLPATCVKKQQIEGTVLVKTKGRFPIFRGDLQLLTRNHLTGETSQTMVTSGFSTEEKALQFVLASDHCGGIQTVITGVDVYDPFGLWKKTLLVQAESRVSVLPDTFALDLTLANGTLSNQDSIEYAQGRTGDDLSEIYAIREYQEGDHIRNIHWKLSGKYDELMVKLASMPLEKSLLLLMETDVKQEDDFQPDAFDAISEIYITISQSLLDNEIGHKVGWYDHDSQRMFLFEINDEEDLHGIMSKHLTAGRAVTGDNAIARYLREMGHFEQAHVVYVTHEDEGRLESLSDDLIKTVVVCSENGAQASGVYDYSCTPEDYSIQLRAMTI